MPSEGLKSLKEKAVSWLNAGVPFEKWKSVPELPDMGLDLASTPGKKSKSLKGKDVSWLDVEKSPSE
jgi:hypothetical protein